MTTHLSSGNFSEPFFISTMGKGIYTSASSGWDDAFYNIEVTVFC